MNINEITDTMHGDVRILVRYDTERFAWTVTGLRHVNGRRYGVGVFVETEEGVADASEHVRNRLTENPAGVECYAGNRVYFENLPSVRGAS